MGAIHIIRVNWHPCLPLFLWKLHVADDSIRPGQGRLFRDPIAAPAQMNLYSTLYLSST
jgi:hypothetical protein